MLRPHAANMIPRVLSLLAVSVLWLVGAVAAQPAAEWRVLLNKAVSLRDSGAPDAEAAFEEAAAKAKFLGDSGLAMAIVSNNLSVLLLRQGRYDTAEEKLTSAIRIYEQLADAPAVEVAAALHNLGFLKRQVGKREEEEAYFRLAVERMEKHKPVNAMVLVQMLGNLALHYVENGRLPAAVPLLESASRYETEAVVSQHPFRVPLLIASSEFHLQRGETQVAREKAALALRIVENAKWLRDLEIAGPLHQLARTEMEMGRLREAETHWKRSLDIIRARRSESYP